jgi:hypothetical protein
MDANELRAKLNAILEAIAAGRTCEQILAADRTLSYHDIFHAVAEAPTSFWSKTSRRKAGKASPPSQPSLRSPLRHRAD